MKISGYQKLSLVDYDGHISATVFVSGCNFLCPFCHNSGLVKGTEPELNKEDIIAHLQKRKGIIDSVVVSGGEPTLYPDLPIFIEELKKLGLLVKLDTNGTNLDMVKYLVENKLIDYIAMDIKNSLEKYSTTIGKDNYPKVIEDTIKYIMSCGIDYEFRTTLIQGYHNIDDIVKIGELIKGAKKYYLQKFIDSGNCIQSNLRPIDIETAQEFKKQLSKTINLVQLRY